MYFSHQRIHYCAHFSPSGVFKYSKTFTATVRTAHPRGGLWWHFQIRTENTFIFPAHCDPSWLQPAGKNQIHCLFSSSPSVLWRKWFIVFRMIHTQHLVSLTLFTCVLCLCERVISVCVCVCVISHAILFIFFYMWYCVFLFLQTCELARRLSEGDVHFEWTEAETIALNRLPVNGVCECRGSRDVNKLYVLIQKIMMHAVTIKNNCHGHKSTRKMNHVCFFFFLSIWKVRCQFTSWTARFKTFNDMRVFCCLVTDSWTD